MFAFLSGFIAGTMLWVRTLRLYGSQDKEYESSVKS
jgi:hypothetical protein